MTEDGGLCQEALTAIVSDPGYLLESDWDTRTASNYARWISETVMLTYDWCHFAMTPEQRQTLQTRWNNYLEVLRDKPWGGAGYTEYDNFAANNYFWGYWRNELEWGITTKHENSDPDDGADRAQDFIDHALNTRLGQYFAGHYDLFGQGGVAAEGSQYGGYMMEYATIPYLGAMLYGAELPNLNAFCWTTLATDNNRLSYGCDDSYFFLFPFNDDEFFRQCDNVTAAMNDTYGPMMLALQRRYPGAPLAAYIQSWIDRTGSTPAPWHRALAEPAASSDVDAPPLDYFAPAQVTLTPGKAGTIRPPLCFYKWGRRAASATSIWMEVLSRFGEQDDL